MLSLDHLVLTVSDIDATVDFYVNALGMERQDFPVADGSTRVALSMDHQKINLHQAGAEFDPKAHRPCPGSADLCFVSDRNMEVWVKHLAEQGIKIIEGPVPRTGAKGPMTSVYVRDPDLNLIELSKYD